ncbi:protein kinase domain-containing protein [Trichonephila clavata]|uniref:Serine/threonine-protein kinase 1 n=1 Tax=Trichonephila clavata TaxID=2740835 RepID=A0A8X6I952_TRICU|nr:protein kinase domain-containing protein [Trichonephila clavata]
MLSTEDALEALRQDYTLKHLETGMYGTVYAGENVQENEQVAIKVIGKEKVLPYIDSLPAEIHFLSELKNEEGVIQLIKHIECIDGYIIIMENCSKSLDLLRYLIKNQPIPISTVKKIILQIIEICLKLFKLNIYHGDLKLENIVIHTETLNVKFIDFGGAGYLDDPKDFSGTKYYLPPEYHEKKIYEVEPVHVWAIGLILKDLVTGLQEEEGIFEEGAVPYETIDKKVKSVVQKCLKSDYVNRIKLSKLKQMIENELVDCCEVA